jgi:hypothetical protein
MATQNIANPAIFYSGEIVDARTAFDRRQTRYFTGNPCSKGHVAQRMVSNGACIECLKRATAYRRTKEWRAAHPDSRTEEARKWRRKHPALAAEIKARYREKHLERIREEDKLRARRIRAIAPERQKQVVSRSRQKRIAAQEVEAGRPRPDRCELCGGNDDRIVFDHDHSTGRFRGWICDRCNKTLGHVKDNPNYLRMLAQYLEKSHG